MRPKEALEALLAKATPRPWRTEEDAAGTLDILACEPEEAARFVTEYMKPDDALLIVAAVNLLPSLLSELARLSKLVAEREGAPQDEVTARRQSRNLELAIRDLICDDIEAVHTGLYTAKDGTKRAARWVAQSLTPGGYLRSFLAPLPPRWGRQDVKRGSFFSTRGLTALFVLGALAFVAFAVVVTHR